MKVIAAVTVGAIAASIGAMLASQSSDRDPDLIGERTSVYHPDDVRLGWFGGLSIEVDAVVPSPTAIYDHPSKPMLTLLGCDFDIVISEANDRVLSASNALRKTVLRGTPTDANGMLANPRPSRISDPPTILKCDHSSAFTFFLYRNPVGFFGNAGLTAVVLEHANDNRSVAEGWIEEFDETLPSSELAFALLSSSKRMYQVQLMTPEAVDRAERENEALLGWIVGNGPKLIALAAAL